MVQAKKHEHPIHPDRLRHAAMGIEAECSLMVDGQPTQPEDLFGSPRDFIRGELMHRQGRSYHLPTGSAVYFDTGVIEVATPVIELERGCAARAGRQLWEGLHFIRGELDAWDARQGRETRLVGFSTHYNVSFELPPGEAGNGRTIGQLARLLTYILPAPVMLLATNRRSTGVGVRPRPGRIEITCDFTPSAPLMIATAALVVGVVREAMRWPSYRLDALAEHGIPVISGFEPMPHTSRKGWLARFDCYPRSPFTCDIDQDLWPTEGHGALSLRAIAQRTLSHFWRPIRRMSDPFTLRLIASVVGGRSASLLQLEDRPPEYEHVGGHSGQGEQIQPGPLARSRYERVVMRAITGQPLRLNGRRLQPVGMRGWSAVVFQREDASREVIALDELVDQLDHWE